MSIVDETKLIPTTSPITDDQVTQRLIALFAQVDLNVTSARMIREQLEQSFGGIDLKPRKAMINATLDRLVKEKCEKEQKDKKASDGNSEKEKKKKDKKKKKKQPQHDEVSDDGPALMASGRPRRAVAANRVMESERLMQKRADREKAKQDPDRRPRRGGGRALLLSPALQSIVCRPVGPKANGDAKLSLQDRDEGHDDDKLNRGEVVKRLWAYIREHQLQKPTDKRIIMVDDQLAKIFGKRKTIGMFAMNKLLSRHMYKEHEVAHDGTSSEEDDDDIDESQEKQDNDEEEEEEGEAEERKRKLDKVDKSDDRNKVTKSLEHRAAVSPADQETSDGSSDDEKTTSMPGKAKKNAEESSEGDSSSEDSDSGE